MVSHAAGTVPHPASAGAQFGSRTIIAVRIFALRVRTKDTDIRTKGTDIRTKGTDIRTKGTDIRTKGTDDCTRPVPVPRFGSRTVVHLAIGHLHLRRDVQHATSKKATCGGRRARRAPRNAPRRRATDNTHLSIRRVPRRRIYGACMGRWMGR